MQIMIGLPVMLPGRLVEGIRELHAQALGELEAMSGQLRAIDSDLGNLQMSLYESPSSHPLINKFWTKPEFRDFSLLIVSAEIDQYIQRLVSEFRNSNQSSLREHPEYFAADFAAEELEYQVSHLLLISNLIRPGSLSTASGFVLRDEALLRKSTGFFAEDWCVSVADAVEAGWPTFSKVSLREAWKWLERSDCIDAGVGEGPLGTAWAALSHLSGTSPQRGGAMDLVWGLIGLEALYGKGNTELTRQLVSKTELFLGPRAKKKDAFRQMYNYRSRLLHGDIAIPVRFTPNLGAEEEELDTNAGLALAVLIATLQEMARRGWHRIEFEYVLSDRSRAGGNDSNGPA